jgi:hypothetical protein
MTSTTAALVLASRTGLLVSLVRAWRAATGPARATWRRAALREIADLKHGNAP